MDNDQYESQPHLLHVRDEWHIHSRRPQVPLDVSLDMQKPVGNFSENSEKFNFRPMGACLEGSIVLLANQNKVSQADRQNVDMTYLSYDTPFA